MLLMKKIDEFVTKQKEKHDEETARVLERLDLLVHCCKEKIKQYRTEMETAFLEDQEKHASYCIVGRPISYIAEYHVDIHDGISNEINKAIDQLFSFRTENVKKSLAVLVKSTLGELIPSASAGEDYCDAFYIVPYNNAIVRIDFRAWKYNLVSEGVIGEVRNAICYIASKSIIDYHKLTASELIYFVSDQLSTALGSEADLTKVEDYIEKLEHVWNMVEHRAAKEVLEEAKKEPLKERERNW